MTGSRTGSFWERNNRTWLVFRTTLETVKTLAGDRKRFPAQRVV